MSEELRPCPFCGYTCGSYQIGNQGIKWGAVVCGNCGASGPEVRTNYDVAENAPWHANAAKEWNTRESVE